MPNMVPMSSQEIAWGRRHITVVHGELLDDVEAELVDELFAVWEEIATMAAWSRIGGVPDHHLTLTIAGATTDSLIPVAINSARHLTPGRWRVAESAFPN